MTLRVDHDDVAEIIDTSIADTTPFITTAHNLIEVVLDTADQTLLGEDLLAEIEKWLAAHFVSIREPRVRSTTVGAARDEYMLGANTGDGLRSTPYGQQACAIDLTGKLAIIGKSQNASFKAIDLGL